MANTLRFKRGLASGLPTGVAGEPLFTTDTFDLYIGTGAANQRFQKYIASGTTLQYLRGDGTLATFPSLTGFVPYTGATANVDLGVFTILAQNATFASNGSTGTATINHSSGSGIALNITKGGNGEGLYINKTSGSGNAATILGTLNATTLVKSGGLSTEYLKADGSVSTLTNPITGTGVSGQVAYWSGASTQVGSNNLFWDNTNGRLGVGTNSPSQRLVVYGSGTAQVKLGISDAANWEFGRDNATTGDLVFTNNLSGSTFIGFRVKQATGRFIIGSDFDSGQRLQVTGDTLLKGSGNTSATNALTVQNSDAATLIRVRNDGAILYGQSGAYIATIAAGTGSINVAGAGLGFLQNDGSSGGRSFLFSGASIVTTSGIRNNVQVLQTFAPTSGTAVFNNLLLEQTINQTGGANGITRGLYVNPTLTAAADWRSIETSNNTGWAFYGAGTANSFFNGSVGIGTTALSIYNLHIGKNITGSFPFAVWQDGTVQSTASNIINGFQNSLRTQAASFVISEYNHFSVEQYALGAGSSVTSQKGFNVDNTMTGATNNYGFYGNIASGTGRWNLYMNGTAANYLNGNLGVGAFPSAWGATIKALELPGGISFFGLGSAPGDAYITQNATFNGTNWIYKSTAASSIYRIQTGSHAWFNAPSGTAGNSIVLTQAMTLTNAGRLILGAGDSGELLQVNGTMKVTGASTFQADMQLSKSNASLAEFIINDGFTSSTTTEGRLRVQAASTQGYFIANGPLHSTYKIQGAGDVSIYKSGTDGNITILNDRSTGNILMAAGGSSTAHFTIASTGAATFSSSVTTGGNILIGATASTIGAMNFIRTNTSPVAARLTFGTDGTGYSFVIGKNQAGTVTDFINLNDSGNFGIGISPLYKLDVTGEARVSSAIAIGTTPDTNKPFKILKNINATVGINFENTSTSANAFSAIQMGTDVTGGTKFTNLVYASSGVTANGVYNPDGTSLINNGGGGLNFLGTPTRFYTGGSNGVLRLMLDNEGTTQYNATTPTTNATDGYKQYSADVVAGNAAPHFRTENGAVVKLYQETTSVGNAIISLGGGMPVLDDTTFDGYTLRQIVKALRNQGILA